MRTAKGGNLFYENYGEGADSYYDLQREYVEELPTVRNKVLHEGHTAIPPGMAIEYVLAVLNATDWLFAGVSTP